MINTKTVQVSQNEIVSITCDKCGKVLTPDNAMEYQEVYSVWFTGGYCSVFGDGANVAADFCQQCLKELIGPYYRIDQEERL